MFCASISDCEMGAIGGAGTLEVSGGGAGISAPGAKAPSSVPSAGISPVPSPPYVVSSAGGGSSGSGSASGSGSSLSMST